MIHKSTNILECNQKIFQNVFLYSVVNFSTVRLKTDTGTNHSLRAFKYFKAPQQYWYKRNAFINFFLNIFLSSSPNTLYLEEKTSSVSFNGCNDVKGHTYWKLCTKIPKLYSILYMRESDLITFRNGFKGKVLYQFSFGWVLWN